MTPRDPNRTPLPSSLTDSQRELVAVAAEAAAEETIARSTPLPHETTKNATRAAAWWDCEKCGPAKTLSDRMDKMEAKQQTQQDFINQYLGEQKFKRFVLPVLIGLMGSSVGAIVVGLVLKGIAHQR